MPPVQPQNPNPDFDFMLKNQPQAKRTLGLPALSKPMKIGLAVVGAVIILIGLSAIFSRGGGVSSAIAGVLARGAEIQRITAEVQQLTLQDPATKALAATVATTLNSDQVQLVQYLKSNKSGVSPAQLAVDTDKSSDGVMQSASQNNNLDQTYVTYLQQGLAKYRSDLQSAYDASGPKGKAILKSSFDGVNTLLTTTPLKA
jgi:hypothetical protein